MRTVCQLPDCDKAEHARRYCKTHYRRFMRHGDPYRVIHPRESTHQQPRSTNEERFWALVDKGEGAGCWLWRGAISSTGYGSFRKRIDRGIVKTVNSHTFAYQALVGEVPAGKELDHLCRVRACVNPAHLEAVTHRVNAVRGFIARNGALSDGKWTCDVCEVTILMDNRGRHVKGSRHIENDGRAA